MIRIGRIVAAHGLQGAVILTHIAGNSAWLKKDGVIFLELNKGSYIPFFVTEARVTGEDEYIVSLDELTQPEQAKKLIGKQVYVQEDILDGHIEDSPLLWIGFNIVDRQKGSLGPVEDVLQTGHQWLAKISYNGKEVLIPLIDQMIIDVNNRNKFIRMDLPDGLLDI